MKKYLLVISFLLSLVSFSEDALAQEAEQTKESYNFGGHVFTNNLPITLGTAFLYTEENPYRPIDTTDIDTLGYYYFYRIEAGNYYVAAGLVQGDPNYQFFFPTLYPSALETADAEIIQLKETSWEYDINLIYNDFTASFGPGKIGGTINQIGEKPTLSGVEILLFDEYMVPITHIPTNQLGQFSFEGLNYGTYIIYPQIIGLITNPIEVTINAENTSHENIEISVEDGYISSTINEALISEASFRFYPNPASSLINIEFSTTGNKNIQTRISDISGRVVFEESSKLVSSHYSNTLQVRNWQNGYYFVEIFIDGALASTQKLVVSH